MLAVLTEHTATRRLFVADPTNARVAQLSFDGAARVEAMIGTAARGAVNGWAGHAQLHTPVYAMPTRDGSHLVVCDRGSGGSLRRMDTESLMVTNLHPRPDSALVSFLKSALPRHMAKVPKSLMVPVSMVEQDSGDFTVLDASGSLWSMSSSGSRVRQASSSLDDFKERLQEVASSSFTLVDGRLADISTGRPVSLSNLSGLGVPRGEALHVAEMPLQMVPYGNVLLRLHFSSASGLPFSEPVRAARVLTEGSLAERSLLQDLPAGASLVKARSQWEPGVTDDDLEPEPEAPLLPQWDEDDGALQVDLAVVRGTGNVIVDVAAYHEEQQASYVRLVIPLRVAAEAEAAPITTRIDLPVKL